MSVPYVQVTDWRIMGRGDNGRLRVLRDGFRSKTQADKALRSGDYPAGSYVRSQKRRG